MNKRYIAYLDILGFKDLARNNDIGHLQELYKRSIEDGFKESLGLANKIGTQFIDNKLNVIVISDSVIIWSEYDSFNAFAKLVVTVNFLMYSFMYKGLPLRGAIVYDELEAISIPEYIDVFNLPSKSIIGKGLINAYSLETSQNLVSCLIEDDCINHFKDQTPTENNNVDIFNFKEMVHWEFIIEYDLPTKEGLNRVHVINWPRAIRTKKPSAEDIRAQFSKHKKNIDNNEVRTKIENTISFVNYCWSKRS